MKTRRPANWVLGGIASVNIAVAAGMLFVRRPAHGAIDELIAAADRAAYRPIEARLTGFPYKPLAPLSRGKRDSDPLRELRAVAGDLLRSHASDPAREARRAAAIALLMAHSEQRGVVLLEELAREQNGDAHAWSDLAAARHAVAASSLNPHDFVMALAAADHALAIDPDLPEALFNRAAALERLHLNEVAAAAFGRAAADHASPWAAEANTRLARLHTRASSRWADQRPVLENAIRTGDMAIARGVIRQHRQETRITTEIEVLGAWGEAILSDRRDDAQRQLNYARVVAVELAASGGDPMLADVVEMIERATVEQRQQLATAHAQYCAGRIAHRARKVAEALPALRDSAALFERLQSPMSFSARCFEAAVLTDLQQPARALEVIGTQQPPELYPAVRAHLLWQQGTAQGTLGAVIESRSAYRRSAALFQTLREPINAATVEQMALTHDFALGSTANAWQSLTQIFGKLSMDHADELQRALTAAARAEAGEEHWEAARSLIDVNWELGLVGLNARRETNLWTQRAMASLSIGSPDAATDIRKAKDAARAIPSAPLRDAALFDIQLAEARLESRANPARAIRELTANIAWAAKSEYRLRLPQQYVERARVRLASGDRPGAEADLRDAFTLIEDRAIGLDLHSRAGLLTALGEVVDGLVEALAGHGATARAFEIMERRSDALASPALPSAEAIAVLPQIPRDHLLVHYAILRDRVLLFSLGAGGLDVQQLPVERRTVETAIREFASATEQGKEHEAKRIAAQLFDIFVRPLIARITPNGYLAIVADDGLVSRLPFAAMAAGPSAPYLVETMHVLYTRSVRRYVAALERRNESRRRSGVLIVGDPAFASAQLADLPRLASAERESIEIARLYGTDPLTGEAATDVRVLERIRESAIFHFAGHAVLNEIDGRESGLILAPAHGTTGVVYLRQLESANLDGVRVAVLAGCRTATPTARRAAISLASSMLAAGAATAVGTMWDVDDEATREFSLRLHTLLAHDTSVEDAIRTVQRQMAGSNQSSLRALHAWSGFQLWKG